MTGWECASFGVTRRERDNEETPGRSGEELQGVDRKNRGWGWAQLGTESPD